MTKPIPNKKLPIPKKPQTKRRVVKKKTLSNGLTIKQERFCHAYMETGNASEAYRQSYNCERMKDTSIHRNAKATMDNTKIAARLLKLKEEMKEVSTIKKERLLYELEAITTSKITDYVEIKNVIVTHEDPLTGMPIPINTPLLMFKDFDKLSDQQIRAIEGIKMGKFGVELKLHGKSWSIDRINKILGQEAPKQTDITSKGKRIQLGPVILKDNGRG